MFYFFQFPSESTEKNDYESNEDKLNFMILCIYYVCYMYEEIR